jgi:hypothetical protein
MKKILLLGFILAILLFAFPQGVLAATDSKGAEVTASVADTCIVTASFTEPTGGWILERNAPNALSPGIHVTVDSSSPWGLVASDEKTGLTKGFMTSGGSQLSTPFVFRTGGLATPQTLFPSGSPAQPVTGYDYDIGQPVTATDNSALSYTITVTFTLTSL